MPDTDVKIFSPHANIKPQDADLDALRHFVDTERETLDAAKVLGRSLALHSTDTAENKALLLRYDAFGGEDIEKQLAVLRVFCGENAICACLTPAVVSDTAIAALHSELIHIDKLFWDTIAEGPAVTRYLLELSGSDSRNAPQIVGRVFACLCGRDDDLPLRTLGAETMRTQHDWVSARWEKKTHPPTDK
jgi:hypothetical protein